MKFSENLTKRLVQAKQIFLHGKIHSFSASELDRLFTILSIDQAIEHFLHTLIIEYNVTKLKSPLNAKFKEIFDASNDEIKNVLKKELPLKTAVFTVHNLRNIAQHYGTIPSESEIQKSVIYCEDFLLQSYNLCFNKNYEEVFLSELIIDDDVRKHFREGEIALSNEKYKDAMAHIGLSFHLLRFHEEKLLPYRSSIRSFSGFRLSDIVSRIIDKDKRHRSSEFKNLLDSILKEIEYVDDKVSILSVGGKLQDYNLFKKITPHYNIFPSGKFETIYTKSEQENPERSDCFRVMNFVYNYIINSQSLR